MYGDLLASAVLCVVKENEDFITGPTIVSLLRGTKVRSKRTYDSSQQGQFSSVPADQITEMLQTLIWNGLTGVFGRYAPQFLWNAGAIRNADVMKIKKTVMSIRKILSSEKSDGRIFLDKKIFQEYNNNKETKKIGKENFYGCC